MKSNIPQKALLLKKLILILHGKKKIVSKSKIKKSKPTK